MHLRCPCRRVDLPQITVEALREHRRLQLEERFAWGVRRKDDDLVFAQLDGGVLKPGSFSKAVTAAAAMAGLPGVTLHGLRHSHASHLCRQGAHPKLVSERHGHSSTGITLDLYSHLLDGMQEEAVRRLGEAFRRASSET